VSKCIFPLSRSSEKHLFPLDRILRSLLARHLLPVLARRRARHQLMAQAAPAIGHNKTSIRIEWADGERYEARLDITHATAEAPLPSPATSAAPWNSSPVGCVRPHDRRATESLPRRGRAVLPARRVGRQDSRRLRVGRLPVTTTFDATYDPADDKLRLRASSRLDAETYAKVKAAGFGWAPKQDLFYAVWTPAREDLLVELASEIGDEETSPPTGPPSVPTDSLPIKQASRRRGASSQVSLGNRRRHPPRPAHSRWPPLRAPRPARRREDRERHAESHEALGHEPVLAGPRRQRHRARTIPGAACSACPKDQEARSRVARLPARHRQGGKGSQAVGGRAADP